MSGKPLGQKIKRLNDRLDNLRKLSEAEPNITEILDKLLDSLDGEAVNAIEDANRVLELATLNKISQAFSSWATLKVETVLELVYKQTSLLMDTDSFYVAFYDVYGDTVSFPLAIEEGTRQKPIGEWAPRKAGRGLTEYITRDGDALFIPNNVNEWISRHYNEVELIGRPAKSWLGVPMIAADQVIGVIAVQNYHQEDTYDRHDLDILSTIASQAAIAITNARMFQSTRRQVEELRLLQEVGQTITSAIEPQEVIRRVVQGARRVIGADITALYPLVDGEFQPPVIDGETHAEHKLDPLPRIGGIGSKVLEKGFVIVEDIEKDPEMGSRFTKTEGISSFAGVALRVGRQVVRGKLVGGTPIGVLYVDFRARHFFNEDESDKINLFATQVAIAIQNAWLFEQIRSDLDRRIRELDALAEIDKAITTLDLSTVLDRIIRAACEIVGAPNGSIMLVDESGEYVELRAAQGPPWLKGTRTKFKIGEHGVTGWVAEHKRTALISDVRADEWQDIYIRVLTETLSELVVPLLDEYDVLLGVINLESPKPAAFSEDDQRLLEALAGQAVIAIQNQRRFEAEQRARRELEVLSEVDKAISSTLELEKVLQLILDQGLELLDAAAGTIMLFDKAKGDLWMAVGQGVVEQQKGKRHTLEQGIVGMAARERRCLNIADVTQAPWDEIFLPFIPNIRSELAVPMLRDGRLIGVINAESPEVRAFREADERLFVALAGQAVIAIQNAEQYQRLEMLRKIDRAIISTFDPDHVLNLILDNALQLTGAEIGELRLVDKATKELIVRFSRIPEGVEVDEKWKRIPPSQGITGWTIEHLEPVIVGDAEQNPRYIPYFLGMRSEIAVPLVLHGEALGVVNLESTQVSAFDEYDLKLLETLCDQAVIALQNARLFSQVHQRAIQLQTAAEVSRTATSVLELDRLLPQVVELMHERFALYYVGLFLVDETGEWAILQAGTGEAGKIQLAQGHRLKVSGESMVGWCVANAQARIAPDIGQEAIRFDNPLLPDTRSEMALPLICRGKTIGALTVQSSRRAAFSEEDITALQTMADQLANAIENARFYQAEHARRQELEALQQASLSLTASLELPKVLDAILHAALHLISAQDAHIFLYAEGRLTFGAALWTDGRRETPYSEPRPKGLTYTVARQGEPTIVPDMRTHPLFADVPPDWVGAIAGLPLKIGQRVVGVMTLARQESGSFSEAQLRVLRLLADQAAIAIENARLHKDLQTTYDELRQARDREIWAALGEVTAGLIHKMSNSLGLIPSLTERIEKAVGPVDEAIATKLRHIREGAQDALSYTAGMARILELRKISKEEADIQVLIGDALRQALPESEKQDISLETAYALGLPALCVNAPLVIEAFQNILRNAVEAMPSGGRLHIRLEKVDGKGVEIEISDTGCGIPQEKHRNVFRPGFSLKKEGKGIGLWFCKTVVDEHQGNISFESQEGIGTTFTVFLPVGHPAPADESVSQEVPYV